MRTSTCGLLASAVVPVAGCGGGNREELSYSEWIAQANAICADADRRVHALGSAATLVEVERTLTATSKILSRRQRRLRELPPPKSDGATVEAIVGFLDHEVVAVERVAEAARSGDQQAVDQAAERLLASDQESDRRVASLGLDECRSDDG